MSISMQYFFIFLSELSPLVGRLTSFKVFFLYKPGEFKVSFCCRILIKSSHVFDNLLLPFHCFHNVHVVWKTDGDAVGPNVF